VGGVIVLGVTWIELMDQAAIDTLTLAQSDVKVSRDLVYFKVAVDVAALTLLRCFGGIFRLSYAPV
jgi:hypothetical protein